MARNAFDFDDLPTGFAELRNFAESPESADRLYARLERGPAPMAAAAVLALRDDRRSESVLAGLAGFLEPGEIAALARFDPADALAIALATRAAPVASRVAAAEALADATPTAAALCALAEIADSERAPPGPQARDALTALNLRADKPTRAAGERIRGRIKFIKTWTGIRRQEVQREVATAALHPIATLLGGDPAFLSTLVPPIADSARPLLFAAIIAAAREATGDQRAKLFATFHARWRDVARAPLSVVARGSFRGREASLPILAVGALAAMAASAELIVAVVSAAPDARAAALSAIEHAGARSWGPTEQSLAHDGLARLIAIGDSASAERLRALAG